MCVCAHAQVVRVKYYKISPDRQLSNIFSSAWTVMTSLQRVTLQTINLDWESTQRPRAVYLFFIKYGTYIQTHFFLNNFPFSKRLVFTLSPARLRTGPVRTRSSARPGRGGHPRTGPVRPDRPARSARTGPPGPVRPDRSARSIV